MAPGCRLAALIQTRAVRFPRIEAILSARLGLVDGGWAPTIPWEVTAVLVDATYVGAAPGEKMLIIRTESTYDCESPSAHPSCDPERDHSALRIPIAAAQLTVGSFTIPINAGPSKTGPNAGGKDCWSGDGSLLGDVEIEGLDPEAMVVRLSNLSVLDTEMRDLLQEEDINVTICP
jgi:hypothetical protein